MGWSLKKTMKKMQLHGAASVLDVKKLKNPKEYVKAVGQGYKQEFSFGAKTYKQFVTGQWGDMLKQGASDTMNVLGKKDTSTGQAVVALAHAGGKAYENYQQESKRANADAAAAATSSGGSTEVALAAPVKEKLPPPPAAEKPSKRAPLPLTPQDPPQPAPKKDFISELFGIFGL